MRLDLIFQRRKNFQIINQMLLLLNPKLFQNFKLIKNDKFNLIF
jgi:hypothetical protein